MLVMMSLAVLNSSTASTVLVHRELQDDEEVAAHTRTCPVFSKDPKSLSFEINATATILDSSLRIRGFYQSARDRILGPVGSYSGYSVSGIGDVNDDGYEDLAVGQPGPGISGTEPGSVTVHYGGPGGLEDGLKRTITSRTGGDWFGHAVAGVGDVNGDGYDDMAVGAPDSDSERGKLYIYQGGPAGLSSSPFNVISGRSQGDRFGHTISGGVDINLDGYDDFVVSSPTHNTTEHPGAGAVSLFLGGELGIVPVSRGDTNLRTDALSYIEGTQTNGHFGYQVAMFRPSPASGPLLVVGASNESHGKANDGAIYIYNFSGTQHLAQKVKTITYTGDGLNLGAVMDAGGDVTGDGFVDLVVGDPFDSQKDSYDGRVLIYKGNPDGFDDDPSLLTGGTGYGSFFGCRVTAIPDMTGDGIDELAVIAGESGIYLDIRTRLYLYEGGKTWLDREPVFDSSSESWDQYFGFCIRGMKDMDGDGLGELLLGNIYDKNTDGEVCGSLIRLPGSSNLLDGPPQFSLTALQDDDGFATDGGPVGDLNGDGLLDYVVGTPRDILGNHSEGSINVYLGSGVSSIPTLSDTIVPNFNFTMFGANVAPAGDVDNDGKDDLLVAAPDHSDSTYTYNGAVYFFSGTEQGVDPTGYEIMSGLYSYSKMGLVMAPAGHMDSSEFGYIVIGTPEYSTDKGKVRIIPGSPTGPDTSNQISIMGNSATMGGDRLGESVAAGGDLNGDGYDDVAIGATFDNNDGSVKVYYGASSGPSSFNYDFITPPDGYKRFGFAVSMVETPDGYLLAVAAEGNGTDLLFYDLNQTVFDDPTIILEGVIDDPYPVMPPITRDLNGDGWGELPVGSVGGRARKVVIADIQSFGTRSSPTITTLDAPENMVSFGANVTAGLPGECPWDPTLTVVMEGLYQGNRWGKMDSYRWTDDGPCTWDSGGEPQNPTITLGDQEIWSFNGSLPQEGITLDITDVLNSYLEANRDNQDLLNGEGNIKIDMTMNFTGAGRLVLDQFQVQYTIYNHPPWIEILEPGGENTTADQEVRIEWTDRDIDSSANIYLYYAYWRDDQNESGWSTLDWFEIGPVPNGEDGGDFYIWDTSKIPHNRLIFVKAVITDDENEHVDYSHPFRVRHQEDNMAPFIQLTSPAQGIISVDENFTITWKDKDIDDDATVKIYCFEDSIQGEGDLIYTINENDENDSFDFNLDKYYDDQLLYFKATIEDSWGKNMSDWAPGQLVINHRGTSIPPSIELLRPLPQGEDVTDVITLAWNDTDIDSNATISIYLDADKIPNSGNEIFLLDVPEGEDGDTDEILYDITHLQNKEIVNGSIWYIRIEIEDEDGSEFQYSGPVYMDFPGIYNAVPDGAFTVLEYEGASAEKNYFVTWYSNDDEELNVSVYYLDHLNSTPTEERLIFHSDRMEGPGSHFWDLSEVEPGDYFLALRMDDGKNPPVLVFSKFPISVIESEIVPFIPSTDFDEIGIDDPLTIEVMVDLDPATLSTSSVILEEGSGRGVEGTVVYDQDNGIITFRPDDPLDPDKTYTLTIFGVKTMDGDIIPQWTVNVRPRSETTPDTDDDDDATSEDDTTMYTLVVVLIVVLLLVLIIAFRKRSREEDRPRYVEGKEAGAIETDMPEQDRRRAPLRAVPRVTQVDGKPVKSEKIEARGIRELPEEELDEIFGTSDIPMMKDGGDVDWESDDDGDLSAAGAEGLQPDGFASQTDSAPSSDIPLEWGTTYITMETDPRDAFRFFRSLMEHDVEVMAITRTPPDRIRQKYKLTKGEYFWMSKKKHRSSIKPSPETLNHDIKEYFRINPKSVVLLEGFEYIISNSDFEKALRLMDDLKESLVLTNSILIVSLLGPTYSEKEITLLEQDSRMLNHDTYKRVDELF